MLHKKLIALRKALGYEDVGGLCQGFSMRYIEAFLIGERARFEERLSLIEQTPPDVLAQSIQILKTKKGPLNSQESDLMEVLSFFDSMELFQNPHSHYVFDTESAISQQSIDVISKVASSQKIQDLGGLYTVNSHPYALTIKEIETYVDKLWELLDNRELSVRSEAPIGLLLTDEYHAVALIYDPSEGGFIFRDINQTTRVLYDSKDIAKHINIAMNNSTPRDQFIPFNAKVILPRNDNRCDLLSDKLAAFQKTHYPIGESFAKRQDKFVNLAFIAARDDHTAALEVLAENKDDLNKPVKGGVTPAFIAAQCCHTATLKLLAKNDADLNKARDNGATPAFIAAHNGHAAALEVLAQNKADLNKARDNGATPAFIAAAKGHAAALEVLAQNKADLNKAGDDGATPAFIAAQNGQLSVMKTLIKFDVDLQAPFLCSHAHLLEFASTKSHEVTQRAKNFLAGKTIDQIKVYPYDIAIIMGHTELAWLISNHFSSKQPKSAHQEIGYKVSTNYASFYNKSSTQNGPKQDGLPEKATIMDNDKVTQGF
ncbi:ankyrin repeat domain-containing protein [Legionella sainthelensi]|uniref:ankyrin repeat domain-containing protein n=1 Tax=Legionella sainthelensi TaxID=28087 RepID=UPI000E208B82|nr:ankyrin repeat domain-containing protein [Legionella sainthelensi]